MARNAPWQTMRSLAFLCRLTVILQELLQQGTNEGAEWISHVLAEYDRGKQEEVLQDEGRPRHRIQIPSAFKSQNCMRKACKSST